MTRLARSAFVVSAWWPSPCDSTPDGRLVSRVSPKTRFSVDLEGHSRGEGLFCGLEMAENGAGSLVSERVVGRLGDRAGSFVLHHGGIAAPEEPPRAFGTGVPGSGTGGFAGLRGEVGFGAGHTVTLRYTLPADPESWSLRLAPTRSRRSSSRFPFLAEMPPSIPLFAGPLADA